jgi:hypothetical protein
MPLTTELRHANIELGELIGRRESRDGLSVYARYATDPLGFARDVLGFEPIPKQVEILDALELNRRVVVRGCNGAGKDAAAAVAALWFCYCREGLALLTAAGLRQVGEVLMRREVRRMWTRAELPGELFELALRIPGHEQTGMLAFTASDPDKFTGHHAPATLVVLSEAQGIEDDIFEGAFACATGANSKLLVVGNPLRPLGKFYELNGADGWTTLRAAASDHPNVIQGREIVPGAVTREFVQDIRREYGEGSPQYRSRVEAEFPLEAAEQLIRAEWLDDAERLWHERRDHWPGPAVLGLDVARQGPDRCVAVVYQNHAIRALRTWRGADSVGSADHVEKSCVELGLDQPATVVDTTGLGWGVFDVLKDRGWPVVSFVAAGNASEPERYANTRAEAAWWLREALESRKLPLPPDPELREELLALTWSLDGQGRTALDSKDVLKARLKRSPDKADAVMLANWHVWPGHRSHVDVSGFRVGDTWAPSNWQTFSWGEGDSGDGDREALDPGVRLI